jgi:hypothetical protein
MAGASLQQRTFKAGFGSILPQREEEDQSFSSANGMPGISS